MWIDYGFTVFYMGEDKNAVNSLSKYYLRERYLQRTITNMRRHCKKITVFVENEFDRNIVLKYHNDCILLQVDDSMMLPMYVCKYIQTSVPLSNNSIIYYTEADQLLVIKDEIKQKVIDNLAKDNLHISMHRMHPYYDERCLNDGFKIRLDGLDYISFNTKTIHDQVSYSEEFYKSPNNIEAFCGAFLINAKNFRKVKFYLVSTIMKVESVPFSCFVSFPCIKTKNIEQLYINHLSGFEYSQLHLPDHIERKEPPLMNEEIFDSSY